MSTSREQDPSPPYTPGRESEAVAGDVAAETEIVASVEIPEGLLEAMSSFPIGVAKELKKLWTYYGEVPVAAEETASQAASEDAPKALIDAIDGLPEDKADRLKEILPHYAGDLALNQ